MKQVIFQYTYRTKYIENDNFTISSNVYTFFGLFCDNGIFVPQSYAYDVVSKNVRLL